MKYCVIFFIFIFSLPVFAYDIDTKGFLTFAYSVSNSEIAYEGNITEDGEWSRGTKAGLQFSSILSKKVDAFLQVLADGDNGRDFNFALDIAHVNYNFNNRHKVLYGKVRLPVYLISDYRLVGSLYPWINPPEEVYKIAPLEDVGANDTFFGISFEGSIFRHGLTDISYRLYTGGSERVTEKENAAGFAEIRIKNLSGALVEFRHDDLLLKYSHLRINSEGEIYDFDDEVYLEDQNFITTYSSFGLKYDNDWVVLMSELANVRGNTRELRDLKSYYVLIGSYLADNDILLHTTFSDILDETKTNRPIFQNTLAFGLNINLDLATVLKFETKLIRVTKEPELLVGPGDEDFEPAGFFEEHPDEDVRTFSVSINSMF